VLKRVRAAGDESKWPRGPRPCPGGWLLAPSAAVVPTGESGGAPAAACRCRPERPRSMRAEPRPTSTQTRCRAPQESRMLSNRSALLRDVIHDHTSCGTQEQGTRSSSSWKCRAHPCPAARCRTGARGGTRALGRLRRRPGGALAYRSCQQERQPAPEHLAHAGRDNQAATEGHPERIRKAPEAIGRGDRQDQGMGRAWRRADQDGKRLFHTADGGNANDVLIHLVQGRRCRVRHPPGLARRRQAGEPIGRDDEPVLRRVRRGVLFAPIGGSGG
jgi:hypothetical protein